MCVCVGPGGGGEKAREGKGLQWGGGPRDLGESRASVSMLFPCTMEILHEGEAKWGGQKVGGLGLSSVTDEWAFDL